MLEITSQVQSLITKGNVWEGLVSVYCPHTTAGITINENADPDVISDLLRRLVKAYQWDDPLDLHGEGNSAAHLKSSIVGVSQLIPIANGTLVLGTWQGIFFCEFDGPRQRYYYVKILAEA